MKQQNTKRKKRQQERKESLKRTLFNGIMIIAVVLLVVSIAITGLIFFMVKKAPGSVAFPESPLTKLIDQPYSYLEDETLDVLIECPTIPAMLSVGGAERFVSENGCVFRYNQELSISIYEMEDSSYDLLENEFAANLYNGEISGEINYVPEFANQDVGYFNGFPAEYQCGTIEVFDENGIVYRRIYVLSMVLDLGFDKNLFIGVSTTEENGLYSASLLMENIAYTIVDISLTKERIEKNTAEEAKPGNVNVTVESEVIVEEVENTPTQTASGFQYMDIEIPLLQNYPEGAVVVLQYTNTMADVSGLQIKDIATNGMSLIDGGSTNGLAFFGLKEGKKGNYALRIPAEVDLGVYSTRIMSLTDFVNEYGAILTSISMESLPVQTGELPVEETAVPTP